VATAPHVIVAVAAVIERLIFQVRERFRRDPDVVESIFGQLERGNVEGALAAGQGSNDYLARIVVYALSHREKSMSNAFMRAANQELQRFNRGLPVLDTIITLAPLLGLLGTVTGLIHAFGLLGAQELGSPVAITGGIAEALIATALGLGIAIVALIPFNYLAAAWRRRVMKSRMLARSWSYSWLVPRGSSARVNASEPAASRVTDKPLTGPAMNIPSPGARKQARIQIIPLIDIMFFLLATFLMVSLSMVKNQGVNVNVPVASTTSSQELKDYATISITEQGEIYYNKEKIEPDQLGLYLKSLKETYAEPKVFVNGDEKAVFGKS